jgi:hypothetical protein
MFAPLVAQANGGVPAAERTASQESVMNRRKWLWAVLLALPAAVGGLAYATATRTGGYVCPLTGEALPCEKCCPLPEKQQASEEPYICPVTGEELTCPNCCPLNQQK